MHSQHENLTPSLRGGIHIEHLDTGNDSLPPTWNVYGVPQTPHFMTGKEQIKLKKTDNFHSPHNRKT